MRRFLFGKAAAASSSSPTPKISTTNEPKSSSQNNQGTASRNGIASSHRGSLVTFGDPTSPRADANNARRPTRRGWEATTPVLNRILSTGSVASLVAENDPEDTNCKLLQKYGSKIQERPRPPPTTRDFVGSILQSRLHNVVSTTSYHHCDNDPFKIFNINREPAMAPSVSGRACYGSTGDYIVTQRFL
jgi:hypothetical protein